MYSVSDHVADQLWELELAGWEALGAAEPAGFYDRILSRDAMMIVPGAVLDRDAILQSWNGVAPWASYEVSEQSVRRLGSDAMALVYQATAHRHSEERPYTAHMTSVYIFRDGRWQLALHQQTPIL